MDETAYDLREKSNEQHPYQNMETNQNPLKIIDVNIFLT